MSTDEESTPPCGPPPYKESEDRSVAPPYTVSQAINLLELNLKRVDEINLRLRQIGYEEYEYPAIACPEYLASFELSRRGLRSQWIDAALYEKRMGAYLDEYTRTKNELDIKIEVLKSKKLPPDDIPDYTFKEERNGVVFKTTIANYYESHQAAANNLTRFLETSNPVNGMMIFDEKNKLVDEKTRILLETRRLQLNLFQNDNHSV